MTLLPEYDPELRLSWLDAEVDLLRYFLREPTTLVLVPVPAGLSLRPISPLAASCQQQK